MILTKNLQRCVEVSMNVNMTGDLEMWDGMHDT